MCVGPAGWAQGGRGIRALPPWASPGPATLEEPGFPYPIHSSGPRGPGVIWLPFPPLPAHLSPWASEPLEGLGAD